MRSMTEAVAEIVAVLAEVEQPGAGLGSAAAEDHLALRALREQIDVVLLRRLGTLDAAGIGASEGSVGTAAWLRRHTRCSTRTANADVRLARRLYTDQVRPLTETAAMLERGELTVEHAHAIVRATAVLDPEPHAIAEPVIAAEVARLAVDQAGQVAARAARHAQDRHLGTADDPVEARRQHALTERHLELHPCGDLWSVSGLLSPETGQALATALDALSAPAAEDATGPDLRTATQRRADALGDALGLLLASGRLPVHGGHRPQVTVVVDLADLRSGFVERGGRYADGSALTAAETRTVLCDSRIGWLATSTGDGPPGRAGDLDTTIRQELRQISPALGGLATVVLDAGRTSRLVTPALRQALAVRDRGCVFPGCDRPPEWCDAHHLVPWENGGPTDLQNLGLLCRRHHVTAHRGWTLSRSADGSITVSPPGGSPANLPALAA